MLGQHVMAGEPDVPVIWVFVEGRLIGRAYPKINGPDELIDDVDPT